MPSSLPPPSTPLPPAHQPTAGPPGHPDEPFDRRLGQLLELLLDGRTVPLVAVGVADLGAPDGVELYLRTLDHVDDLIGFVAPRAWDAMGVVAAGTAHAGAASGRTEPVEVGHLVDRVGRSVTRLRGPDGEDDLQAGVEGLVPDLCRRALSLPTTSPIQPPTTLFDALWLDAVCAAALARDLGDPPPDWGDVVACFPATTAPGADPPILRRERARAAGSWGALRRRVGLGRLRIPGLRRSEAAWMDDGLFARWSLSSFPPPDELLADLEFLLPARVARRLREVVVDNADAGGRDTDGA